jgi:hypothetical protein
MENSVIFTDELLLANIFFYVSILEDYVQITEILFLFLQAYRKTFQIDGIPEQEDVTTAL